MKNKKDTESFLLTSERSELRERTERTEMKHNRRSGSVFIIIGLLLIAAAMLLTVYNLYDGLRAERSVLSILDELKPMIEEHAPDPDGSVVPDYKLNPEMDMPVRMLKGHDYIGILTIPDIGIELPVMSDWSYPNLKLAPCRYKGSVYQKDLIICAHNYTRHFGKLKTLPPGTAVLFRDMDGNVFSYAVDGIEVLKPRAIEEMEAGEWDLTLFTCTIGGATRVTVRCYLTGN